MLTYNSTLQSAPPYTDAMQAQAQARLKNPWKAQGNAADVYRGEASRAMKGIQDAGASANAAYGNQYNDYQRQLALGGLRLMAEGQQNQAQLRNTALNGLLSGLFS